MTQADLLALLLEQNGCGGFVAEFRFHPTRKWRFDLAVPGAMLAVELEGGVWAQSRHTRGNGYIRDVEKYNAAVLLGWRVLRFTTWDLQNRPQYIIDTVREALKGERDG